jgi:hypothetical protein
MSLRILIFCMAWAGIIWGGDPLAQNHSMKSFRTTADGSIELEDFESDETGQLPRHWFNRNGTNKPWFYRAEDQQKYKYKVLEESGNRFLRYEGWEAKHLNLPLAESEVIDLTKTPVLSWRWRAWRLPEGANEAHHSKNDAALSVYVVFDLTGLLRTPRSIRYTWSSSLPQGKVLSLAGGTQKLVVVESGQSQAGEWRTVSRNLLEDWQQQFGTECPRRPLAILILSDADNTRTWAKGDYDDFRLLTR